MKTIFHTSQRLYSIYDSLFFRVLVIMGVLVSIFDFFKNDAHIAPARIFRNLVMIAVAITYFISIKKRGISQSWRCVLMWSVLFSQIALAIYTAIVP